MTITLDDWQKYLDEKQPTAPRPPVTNEQRASAERAAQAINHPGFAILQDALTKLREREQGRLKGLEHRLTRGRGVTADEMRFLREDIANCAGWLAGLDAALTTLPEVVKAGQE